MRKFLLLIFLLFSSQKSYEPLKIYKAPYLYKGEKYIIYYPAYPSGNKKLLFLHGWNLLPMEFFYKTSALDFLLNRNYTIIIPEMGKSVYSSRFFQETKSWVRNYPSLDFVIKLAYEFKPNILLGISTGARGAALLNITTRDSLFDFIILLSGDYDQTEMPNDRLMTAAYGSYSKYPGRWQKIDNPYYNLSRWQTPTFIAHAADDPIVSVSQSRMFCKKLKAITPGKIICYFPEKGGHSYHFWEKAFLFAGKYME